MLLMPLCEKGTFCSLLCYKFPLLGGLPGVDSDNGLLKACLKRMFFHLEPLKNFVTFMLFKLFILTVSHETEGDPSIPGS